MHLLRIGHYAHDLGAPGGVTTYARRVGAAQEALGHSVTYFTSAPEEAPPELRYHAVADADDLFAQSIDLGLDIVHLHKPVTTLPPPSLPVLRTVHGNNGACPSGRRYLGRTHSPCDRVFGIGTCVWGHVIDECGSRKPTNIYQNIQRTRRERRLLPHLHAYAVSAFVREQMLRMGYPGDRLHVIPSPAPEVDVRPAPIPAGGVPRLLYLGRIVPQKGLDWLLRALARVTVPVHLDVAGDGYLRSDMQRLAGTLGVDERVTFHGWVSAENVPGLIARSRMVVFPSIWHEPAGLVSLEAAAHGRPVIASRVGGIPEYARPTFARLVDPNDVDGLAREITALATDRDLAVRLGEAGPRTAREHFAMDVFLDRLFDLYAQAGAPAARVSAPH